MEQLLAVCSPGSGDEERVAYRAELYRLDYCINTIEASL